MHKIKAVKIKIVILVSKIINVEDTMVVAATITVVAVTSSKTKELVVALAGDAVAIITCKTL